jgi:heme-degrading monooxygenase HmoA
MIARLWHGWTSRQNADTYEALLRTKVLPGIHRVDGYRGAYLLRRDDGAEVAFVTITLFESMEAVRAFAGRDHERARFDETSVHYEVRYGPGDAG